MGGGHLCPDPLGHLGRAVRVGLDQHQGELLAAEARRQVDLAA